MTGVLRVATWNVNSVKARLPHLLAWLRAVAPDVVLLQETKVADGAFPANDVGDLGYNAASIGQKAYNGVAVLSKQPIDVLARSLLGEDDTQARYLETFTCGIRVASLYVPNGNPVDSAKFDYKLNWLSRLRDRADVLLASQDPFILGGDWNVAPVDEDVYDPVGWQNDALCRPESRAAYRRLLNRGLRDAVGAFPLHAHRYTWWDYRAGAFAADHGLRIDHLLLSPEIADRLVSADVDRTPRTWDRPSDHAPVWCTLQSA